MKRSRSLSQEKIKVQEDVDKNVVIDNIQEILPNIQKHPKNDAVKDVDLLKKLESESGVEDNKTGSQIEGENDKQSDESKLESECLHTNKNIIILENPEESVSEGHTDESADSDASVNNNLQMKCKTPDLVPTSFQDKRFVDKRRSISIIYMPKEVRFRTN